MEKETILVIGAGAMGAGIAQVSAAANHDVYLYDVDADSVTNALSKMETSMKKRIEKQKMTQEESDKVLANITKAVSIEECKGVTLVIEAIVENLDIKVDVFKKCEQAFDEKTIIATNTSSIPISEIAAKLERPENFIGLHFFNPVPAMKLVEIISGLKSAKEAADKSKSFVESLNKEGVFVKDGPGFLVNRINNAMKNEAFACLQEGVASIEDIDKAMKYGLGHPMGPFELNDLTGLDIGLSIAEVLWENFRESRWKPFLPLKQLVQSGDYGKKTGKGWYDYTDGIKKPRNDLNF